MVLRVTGRAVDHGPSNYATPRYDVYYLWTLTVRNSFHTAELHPRGELQDDTETPIF